MRLTRLTCAIALAAASATFASPTAGAAAGCTGTDSPWPAYSGPGLGARHQPDTTITPDNAGDLELKWSINTSSLGRGDIQSTPILAGGCVIVTTNLGTVAALTPDGEKVWAYQVETTGTGLGGAIVGSAAIADGKVIVGVGQSTTPFVVALDLEDGGFAWQTEVDNHPGNFISASPVVAGDLVFVGVSGDEYSSTARGGYAFLDPTDGSIEAFNYTIDDVEYAQGYRGASIWATGAYADGYIYTGGGNPAAKTLEHRYSNALLKIDADPASPKFGEIVDAYKGNVDQYYPGLDRQPVCEQFGNQEPNIPSYPWGVSCVQFDIDFGASPNLWHDDRGRLMMGALQKSGVYHTLYADTMQLAWSSIVGGPCFACNASSSATDSSLVFNAGTPGGVLSAITADGGKYRWALPLGDGIHFQSVTVAGGVVYTVTGHGLLVAADAETGALLAAKSYRLDTGSSGSAVSSAGVSVSSDTVYAPSGSVLAAYHVGA